MSSSSSSSTTIIRVHALHGARDSSRAVSYIVQIDDHRIMLDCGWDTSLSDSMADIYRKNAHSLDAILISYPDVSHLGALPFLMGKCGVNCPVYATTPCHNMGLMFMYDLWLSRFEAGFSETGSAISLDDIDYAFGQMELVKYNQTVRVVGSVSVCPVRSGHMIGGSAWRILMGANALEPDEHIIYAVDFDHKKENHLCGLDWLAQPAETFSKERVPGINIRPTLLITDCHGHSLAPRRRNRDKALISVISETVKRLGDDSGDVLICSDSAGRVLEIMYVLDQAWQRNDLHGLSNFPVVFISHTAYNSVDFAKSMVEWMNDELSRRFETKRQNPFLLKHIQLCHNFDELARISSPRILIASGADLEAGFARQLFVEMARSHKNSVILTERGDSYTLAHFLVEMIERQGERDFPPIKLDMKRRVALEGEELLEAMKTRKSSHPTTEPLNTQTVLLQSEMGAPDHSDFPEGFFDEDPINEFPRDIAPTQFKLMDDLEFRSSTQQQTLFQSSVEREYTDEYGAVITNQIIENIVNDESAADDSTISKNQSMRMSGTAAASKKRQLDALTKPGKQVVQTVNLDIQARITFIDFEGISSNEAVKRLLREVRPRNLCVVHSEPDFTDDMVQYFLQIFPENRAYSPNAGEVADITQERMMFQVTLNSGLMATLKLKKAGRVGNSDAEGSSTEYLAWISGQLLPKASDDNEFVGRNDQHEKRSLAQTAPVDEQDQQQYQLAPLLPEAKIGQKRDAVFVKEPKLSDLKTVFRAMGMKAEFSGGVLLCDDKVALRKADNGRILMEGPLSDTYFSIRDVVYRSYAIL